MYKDGPIFCLGLFISLLHKIGSCSTLYFLCCYANYLSHMKTNGSVYNLRISILEVCRFFVWFYRKKCCNDHALV